jgi:hypothetical protein
MPNQNPILYPILAVGDLWQKSIVEHIGGIETEIGDNKEDHPRVTSPGLTKYNRAVKITVR